jgi:hypothetical protein
MIKHTVIHITVNSVGQSIGGEIQHTTPATPAHRNVLEAISAAFAIAIEREAARASNGLPEVAFGDRAAMATRLNLLMKRTNPKPYNAAVLDCINSLKN